MLDATVDHGELATPFLTASSAEPILGSMPPLIVPRRAARRSRAR
jgi:hypothetical protein